MRLLTKIKKLLFPNASNEHILEAPESTFSNTQILIKNKLLKEEKAVLEKVERELKKIENKNKLS